MTEQPCDLPDLTEVEAASVLVQLEGVHDRRQREAQLRREHRAEEALRLYTAGYSKTYIARQLGISIQGFVELISRSLAAQHVSVSLETLRAVENTRLDHAQAVIWDKVSQGDDKAINTFLRISRERRRLNGLDAPVDVRLSVAVKQEMDEALRQLEAAILSDIPGEVLSCDDSGEE